MHSGAAPRNPTAVSRCRPRLRDDPDWASCRLPTHSRPLPRYPPQDTVPRDRRQMGTPRLSAPPAPAAARTPRAGPSPRAPDPAPRLRGQRPLARTHPPRPAAREPARRPPVGRTQGTIWWPSSLSWLELRTCSRQAAVAAAARAPPRTSAARPSRAASRRPHRGSGGAARARARARTEPARRGTSLRKDDTAGATRAARRNTLCTPLLPKCACSSRDTPDLTHPAASPRNAWALNE